MFTIIALVGHEPGVGEGIGWTAVTRHCVSTAAASIAQLVEHALRKRMVVGSIPTGGLSCQPGPEIYEQRMGRSEAPLAAQVPFPLQGPMWFWKRAAAIRKRATPGSRSCMTRALATIFGKRFAGPIGTKIRPSNRSAHHSHIRTTRRSWKPRPCGSQSVRIGATGEACKFYIDPVYIRQGRHTPLQQTLAERGFDPRTFGL